MGRKRQKEEVRNKGLASDNEATANDLGLISCCQAKIYLRSCAYLNLTFGAAKNEAERSQKL